MSSRPAPSKKPILTFYGDDFTGSTDVLEVLSAAGIPAVLFLAPPDRKTLARYPHARAIGVAGIGRSQSPQWMDEHLPAVFKRLKAFGAPICHYKTCSTFDSSPEIGNIGRAAEIGKRLFGRAVPAIVGVTKLKRYVIFSNLFAAASISDTRDIYRIDRHPTMSRHPSTPMDEADLRRHLARQTKLRIAGFDFTQMLAADVARQWERSTAENDVVILDTFDEATTLAAGKLLCRYAKDRPAFVIGSSGVEYALSALWQSRRAAKPVQKPCGKADKMAAVCGSGSPVTAEQIEWAQAHGFAAIAIDTVALRENEPKIQAELTAAACEALTKKAGVVLHTALGPNDPRIAATRKILQRQGLSAHDSAARLGSALGKILRDVLAGTGCKRAVLAGGDSSSHALASMGVESLEVAGPLVTGAPLCRINAHDKSINGVEISLKGGQVGNADFFARARNGR